MRWRAGIAIVLGAAALQAPLASAGPPATCQSRAVGQTNHGRLVCGVQLPDETAALATWDGVLGVSPNRGWRRWGTQKLIDFVEELSLDYGTRFPIGPRLVVGDLSRPHGGPFGERYGGVGHASHQNGLDVDIYYPRRDGLEQPPERPQLVDRARAQWLVDRAARAGARFVFIGPNVGLRRTRASVQYLPAYHDNHMHVRIYP
jgi:murein endopeptidase